MNGLQKLQVYDTVGDRHPPASLLGLPLRMLFERKDRFDRYIKEGYTVADMGAGSGYYAIHIAKKMHGTGIVYAVDSGDALVRAMERKVRKLGLTNVRAIKASAAHVTAIPDDAVDFLISNLTICCMVDHVGAVKEMLRVMKPGSMAYVSSTVFRRNGDPRGVDRNEFEQLLYQFKIEKLKHGRLIREALVRKV
jgi:ubiquinone/menaquinone biosynthesis C-methylase UbiE